MHMITPCQLARGRQVWQCHSQSPRYSVTANLCPPFVIGKPARSKCFPLNGIPLGPWEGLTPSQQEFKLQTSLSQTQLKVRFFQIFSWGMEKMRNLEWRIDLGRHKTKFMKTPTCFSNWWTVQRRAPSPCNPIGTWWLLEGLPTAHGSPTWRACLQ